jgi:hypothetical protein
MGTKGSKSVPKHPKAADGRPIVRADSRPEEASTYFTMRGDTATKIGDGTIIQWDFGNADDEVTDSVTTAVPSGCKRKRIKLSFVDDIRIKEGTIYWKNAPFGCYIDFWVVCPDKEYYISYDETPIQAYGDVPLEHYVNHHLIMDDCPMGDELNTEAANEDAIPSNYELWVEITIADGNTSCKGFAELEIYRERTHLLPGESV